jgi:putative tryptophan/tyrosine transport system substrate-binding protein
MQFDRLKRRDFITLVGGVAAWLLAARAQPPAMPVVGWLSGLSGASSTDSVRAFGQGLAETGYVDGRNVAVEYCWAESQYDRLPALVADLVRRQVTVIAATEGNAALAAKAAGTTIPIVFRMAADPIAAGLVASLNRPGGNVTGVTSLNLEVGSKRLELLHDLVPTVTVMAALINPTNRSNTETLSRDLQAAARRLGLQLHILRASADRDIDTAFTTLIQLRAGGLVIGGDPFFFSRMEQLAALALRNGIPAIYQWREFAAAGGLMSYGASLTESYRLAGSYTGRILKGTKPADLPVQQGTKIELIINLKTARALGITFPLSLLGRADGVIE